MNEYIRVATPGVWMVLLAIVILLTGVCAWGVLGRLDTTLSAVAMAQNGEMTVYVKEADIASIEEGMAVRVGESEFQVTGIAAQPISVDGSFSDYALHVGSLQSGEWVYALTVSGSAADGVHSAALVTERIVPISFLLN